MKTLLIVACIIATVSFVPSQKRYFYIVYTADTEEQKNTGYFTIDRATEFPSLKLLYDQAAKQSEVSKEHCIITNIIEFKSAEDFKNFNK